MRLRTTLEEIIASLTADSGSVEADLARARHCILRRSHVVRAWAHEVSVDAVDVLARDEEIRPELRPDRAVLAKVVTGWVDRLVAPKGERSPWVETSLVGLYLSAVGARPGTFARLIDVLGVGFFTRCRRLEGPEGLELAGALWCVLQRASVKLAQSFDVIQRSALEGVGVRERLVRRLPFVATRVILSRQGPMSSLRADPVRGELLSVIEQLEDERALHRRQAEEVLRANANDVQAKREPVPADDEFYATDRDVKMALEEARARQLTAAGVEPPSEGGDLARELPRTLRRLLSDDAIAFVGRSGTDDFGPN